MATKLWNPKSVLASVSGAIVSGYAEGSFIEITTAEDANTLTTGGAGSASFNKNPNKSGTIKFTLLGNSDSINTLEAINLLETPVPIVILNNNDGGWKVVASECMLQKKPDRIGSKEVTNVDVTFIANEILTIPISE